MKTQTVREENKSQYLGYCKQKGDIYSVEVKPCTYHIVAIQDEKETVLIIYKTN